MKKILSILCIFIFLLFVPNAFASSYKFVWKNTVVEVPLYASIEEYKSIPKAMLYVDNQYKSDAIINYSYDGDWLYYLDDVDTTKVGEYQVWYKAYESRYKPGTCPGYKTLVRFVVKDIIPPQIRVLSDDIILRRGSTFDINDNIIVSDDSKTEVQVKILGDLDLNVIGVYTIKVIAIDESFNQSEKSFKVEVYDDRAPEIYFKGSSDKVLDVDLSDDSFNIKDYFEANDGCGNDITDMIEYPSLSIEDVGSFYYSVKVKNDANIESVLTITINVIDNTIPQIVLKKDSIIWDYEDSINNLNLYDYIESLTDNGQSLNICLVDISNDIEQRVGSYVVSYTYSDGTNTATEYLTVKVLTTKSPKIYASNINVSKGENLNLLDYIEVVDDSDSNILSSVIISDEMVDYDTPGKYEVSVYAINSSGVSSTKNFYVSVVENNNLELKDYIIFGLSFCLIAIVIVCLVILIKRKKQNQFKNIE